MSANVEAMVREGINAAKAGNKPEARVLLMKAVELDPYNEDAWLWLSGVVETTEDQRTCLENVLSINPNNDRARKGIAYLSGGPSPVRQPSVPPPPVAPAPPAPSHTPTSVEWDMPATETSSSSSWRPINEPSTSDYDDWVSTLNLPGTQDEAPRGGSPFSTSPSTTATSPFLGFDDEPENEAFGDGPFSSAPMMPEPEPAPEPSFSFSQPPTYRSAPKTSPVPTSPVPREAPSKAQSKAQAKQQKSKALPVADPFPDEDVDSNLFDLTPEVPAEEEESELFGYIPKAIRPTRLPGTHERTPILLVLAALLLIVLNVGVATALALKLLMLS